MAEYLIEAWDGCFNVDSRLHMLCYLCIPQKKESKPNATRQALGIAGATQERRLLPVACTRLFGAGRPVMLRVGCPLVCPTRMPLAVPVCGEDQQRAWVPWSPHDFNCTSS